MKYDHIPRCERCLSPRDLVIRLGALAYEGVSAVGLFLAGQPPQQSTRTMRQAELQEIENYANANSPD